MENLHYLLILIIVTLLVVIYQLVKRTSHVKSASLKTAQKREIAALHNYLDTITERIIIMHFSLDGTIEKVSNAYENIFGYSKSELIGVSIDKNHYSPSRSDKPIWKILEDEGQFEGEMQLFSSDGESYWMYKQIVKHLDVDGNHIGYIAISNDITAAKAYEEQQQYLIDQSRHAVMGEMISMIAHQWRQPLSTIASIISNVQLDIELHAFNEGHFQKDAKKIESILEHLSQTIQDFNNFFKTDKKKINTNIANLVEDAITLIDFKLHGITIERDIDKDFSVMLLQSELLQVIINLLANAADAMENKELPVILISLHNDNEFMTLDISDNGTGIDTEIINKIFDPYFSTKSKNGTGLGLYICKTIVQKHLHGTISVQNLSKGCRFSIHIPLKEDNET